jgi:hypothetical protein
MAPDCGDGTVLVAAVHAGRPVVGIAASDRSQCAAQHAVRRATRVDGWTAATVLGPSTHDSSGPALAGIAGRVALLLIHAHRPVTNPTDTSSTASSGSATDESLPRLAAALACGVPLLRPPGHVVITVSPTRGDDGHLVDTATAVTAVGIAAGLVLVVRCAAVTGQARDAWSTGRRWARRIAVSRRRGWPQICWPAHQDVLVFRTAPTRDLVATAGPARDCDPSSFRAPDVVRRFAVAAGSTS